MEQQNSSIFNFKRFLLAILVPLLLLVSGVGLAFNYYFEKKIMLKSQISGAYKVNRIISETHPAEIPIFGSSRAVMGLIPDTLGADYFNYGMNGTFYNVTLFFLEEECKKKKEKPWIILNLDPFGLQYGNGDISSYIYNANNPAVKALLDTDYKPYFTIPLIKYFGRFDNYYRLYLSNNIELTKITNKGATLEKNIISKKEFDKMVALRADAMPLFEVKLRLKQRLVNIITTHPDRIFVFVVAPYHISCTMNDNINRADSFYREIRAYKNVKLFDFSRLPIPDSLYFNTSHVNFKGAVLYSKALRDSLATIGVR